jgi:hypothetical protein
MEFIPVSTRSCSVGRLRGSVAAEPDCRDCYSTDLPAARSLGATRGEAYNNDNAAFSVI